MLRRFFPGIVLSLCMLIPAVLWLPRALAVTPSSPEDDVTQAHGVFLTFHLEVADLAHVQALWPKLVNFMDLADAYNAKVSLQFSEPWLRYVEEKELSATVQAWEASGHEIALHHHGPTHKFFDGYTERPDLIRTDGWYATPGIYKGNMAKLMSLFAGLTDQPILAAGMSDADIDWPAGVLYYATKAGEDNAKSDLISTPVQTTYNGHVVIKVTNAGYAIDHLGDAAVTLADIENALRSASSDQVLGIVVNDDTISKHFDEIEPLFQLLARYDAQARTIADVVGSYQPVPTATPSASPSPTSTPTPTPAGTPTVTPTPQPFPLVEDAVYTQRGDVRTITIPHTDCANLTASPIQVGHWLIYPNHEHNRNCSGPGPYRHALFGYNLDDGKLYRLRDDAAGEATLTYADERNTLFWNTTFGGTVFMLDDADFSLQRKISVQTTSDSSGVFLDGLYYFGTVNTPTDTCQNPINANCGGVFALDAQGQIVHSLNTHDDFRAWIGTSLVSDGDYLYIGSAKQTKGQEQVEEVYLHGCSVTKVDKALNVLATFDPGDFACYYLPYQGANADSVAGEITLDGAGLWVQYVRPNQAPEHAGQFQVTLYRLDRDLEEQCRMSFPFEPQTQAVGFYAAPTVDQHGHAYLAVTVPDENHTRKGQLLKVTPDCQTTLLAEAPGSFAHASPTLADDAYVLFATDGLLQILTLEGQVVRSYNLATDARVLSTPTLINGVIYVVQEDGSLNIIEHSGLQGYGQAIWPRYRHDNRGTGVLSSDQATPTPMPPGEHRSFLPWVRK